MTRLSRWGLGTLAVAVALTAARPARAAEVDKLLPSGSELAVYINVRQVLDSEIVKKYALEQMKQALQGQDAQQVLGQLGLDPLKDLDRVVIGASGDDPQKVEALVIVRGTFDPTKLFQAAEATAKTQADKVTMVKEGGTTLLKIQGPDMPKPLYATLVDKTTIVIGSKKELALDAVDGKKQTVKPALAALITQMDEKASVSAAWAVAGKLGALPLPGVNDPTVQKNLEKTENLTLTVKVTNEVAVDVGIGMKDEDSAADFGKIVDQALQQAKGFLPLLAGDPKMRPLLEMGKTLATNVKSKQINITAKLSADAIAKTLNPE